MKKELLHTFLPFLSWTGRVNGETLKADALAGLTGAIIVLPQGIAFAEIAGMPPIYGLYTAMVTPVIAALFGSSWHLISGPTTAISLVVFSVASGYAEPKSAEFIQIVLTLTLMAGIMQFILGLARMGTLVNYVSHSVVVGFTAGAAILIATSQMRHVLGFDLPSGLHFWEKWQYISTHVTDTNIFVFGIALFTLVVALLIKRFTPKIPNLLVAMIAGGALAYFLGAQELGISVVGELPAKLPQLSHPDFSLKSIEVLAPNAFAIALLGLIEAVAISKSIATKSNQKLDPSQEFVGQGLSNIVGSFFSSYAGSGSFTRSGLNYSAGAKTPMAAIFAAVMLMLIVLLIAPLTAYLPIAAMGGIIMLVAYNLIDWHGIRQIFHASRREALVFLITLLSTLFFELEFAIYFGVMFSLIFFLQQTSKPRVVTLAPDQNDAGRHFFNVKRRKLKKCPQMRIIRIDGPLYFGSVTSVENKMDKMANGDENHILIVGTGMGLIDLAGAELLVKQAKKWKLKGGGLHLCSLRKQVREFLKRGGYWEELGDDSIYELKEDAVNNIYKKLDRERCLACEARIFLECQHDPELKISN